MSDPSKPTIFLAGATGAIGKPLCRQLVAAGYRVVGTTRYEAKTAMLADLGVEPVVVDVYDAERLRAVVAAAQPEVVIHQLTDLAPLLDGTQSPATFEANSRLREVGTRNLVAAAAAAGAKRMIAESISFVYAAGPLPHREDDPIDENAHGVRSLEEQVLNGPFTGIVLRYGHLYGPGTGVEGRPSTSPLHVEEAARAALLAITRGRAGIYNIAEDGDTVAIDRAAAELGWRPPRGD
ncbi:MAG: short chain dehydrogenase [Chloroflexi bacterium ADurb.Bin325]|nr:MAG: short chain dehydrogenase [Chloroflexi bacterium ADurb.Bin325]